VDSMLLDKSDNTLCLSHDLAGLDKLEPVFIYIWQLLNKADLNPARQSDFFYIEEIKKTVINELSVLIKIEDNSSLDCFLNDKVCSNVPNFLKPFIKQHLESWIQSA